MRCHRHSGPKCQFVPPHILDHIAKVTGVDTREPHPATLSATASKQFRDRRARSMIDLATLTTPRPGKSDRVIHDAQNQWDLTSAQQIRGESDPAVGTPKNANTAYDHVGAVRTFYAEVLGRDSIDHRGMDINVYVNFGVEFDNAFWDEKNIVLGNGDGTIFTDFSKSPDVLGHELTHGVVQYTAKLEYQGQSGALNEHFADVFGSLMEQHMRKEDAGTANWLIGDEVMAEDQYGEALRSMAHPGTAFDNPIMGKDPQPAHMSGYFPGPEDNQGVHINSGIPNRAFYLVAMEIGTTQAGLIWYAGLQNLWATAKFADAATVLSAQARILARENKVARNAAQTVRSAFRDVGIH
ncbi:M4 family metallopeptidase [Streptomyces spongiae]|uniref:Neutral metalloproteinase n=1 Tax=Streptomyces spongiae TaxID=565072 RepID=A0A5N8XPC9_9ACTN|nr:M4 family metallopeptidase [Streptomyces spongiae]MPY61269.1 M4 family metallopeptidase [Streptomyces spongiae]